MAQVTTNKKGGKLLVYQGYSYNFHKNGSGKKIWLCTQNRHQDCIGRLHCLECIPEDGQLAQVLKESGNHNHTPDSASVEKTKVVNKVKAIAAMSSDSTSAIVASAIEGSSTACLGMTQQKRT